VGPPVAALNATESRRPSHRAAPAARYISGSEGRNNRHTRANPGHWATTTLFAGGESRRTPLNTHFNPQRRIEQVSFPILARTCPEVSSSTLVLKNLSGSLEGSSMLPMCTVTLSSMANAASRSSLDPVSFGDPRIVLTGPR